MQQPMTPPFTPQAKLFDYIGRLADTTKLIEQYRQDLPDHYNGVKLRLFTELSDLSHVIESMREAAAMFDAPQDSP